MKRLIERLASFFVPGLVSGCMPSFASSFKARELETELVLNRAD